MRYTFLILALLFCSAGFSQFTIIPKKKIDKHLSKLSESGKLDRETTGINGEKIDSFAHYPGGEAALQVAYKKYMSEIMQRVKFTRRLPIGDFTIWISFIVNADGTLSDFMPVTQFGYAMEEAHFEIYQRSGNWVPAKANGVNIASRVKVSHPFEMKMGGFGR
jgi:hypothetical protein